MKMRSQLEWIMTEILVYVFLLLVLLIPAEMVRSKGGEMVPGIRTMSLIDDATLEKEMAAVLTHVYEAHYSNLRHRHHPSHPWGPHFEDNTVNLTIREGKDVYLDCKVGLIEDKLVSWVRRKSDRLDLLTLGIRNHSSDHRFLSEFKYPNNWRLLIKNTSREDSGVYLCQISTHPPKVLEVHLNIEAPDVFILNSRGERINDVHYKEGSTLQLICIVNNSKSKSVSWYRNSDLLNQDVSRGGVSIKTDMNGGHAKSVLNVARITRKDMGTYWCSAPQRNASIIVHVHNGENPAELYHNGAMGHRTFGTCLLYMLAIFVLFRGTTFSIPPHLFHLVLENKKKSKWS